ncbi:aminotransferase class V-fold PLP-dependent enzyme [Mycolicibacter sp. MYC123]|uniref:Aminotransferase class V-fold PLP-dependent enzyme n=3 Tax=Mycolicibacter TaxID=1073531 RepID=A0ABU5YFF0_9MYCO|nr:MULTISPECIES: aminotransferase class V-fold PLP-dependent enzyme [unclassified Mycolicibacter]MEB3035045.1 aminotransferase class V-fold PLP-dependent enzyme [Mycolicibacter sp. MYC340]MEB3048777.1 aminotransferase class V-fold PLP-dependent enzyme [Mycolicibacter sp. MYC123]MEB3064290.1 aminotransferase class V-fold PLP-dependent enzyme [Mycolicibacter sp. MYC101]MEB3070012.1 aminotransferase class V-fold PLP-dependent enzyme [Mycolicibacter sp. MYC017]
MPGLLPEVDPDGLLEYSVVYTDRALNHMSARFQDVMNDVSAMLREVYHADVAIVVPGNGTCGMEAVARQFANDAEVLVVRNGFFSYRWSQILQTGRITDRITVLKARPTGDGDQAPFAPAPIDEVEEAIARTRPAVVFVPHVETASGILLPDDYLARLGAATAAVGGLLVLDCIASGVVWVDMAALGVDVLVTAPQKGWSADPGCAAVCLSSRAAEVMERTQSTSFALDLKKWRDIMVAYENGGHAYHATMPTGVIRGLRDAMAETRARGFGAVREQQFALGRKVRALLAERGFPSVAAPGFEAPGVVVSYTTDPEIRTGKKFLAQGLQTAAGVPLQCDEPATFSTFRVGLFGLDKLADVEGTVARLSAAIDRIG